MAIAEISSFNGLFFSALTLQQDVSEMHLHMCEPKYKKSLITQHKHTLPQLTIPRYKKIQPLCCKKNKVFEDAILAIEKPYSDIL